MNREQREQVHSWAGEYGIGLSDSQLDLLSVYLDELWEWNKKINLTGLQSPERIIDELILDSLLPAAFLPDQGMFLDVGSGAGIPGIPLKIAKPRGHACLLEANFKKTTFLKHVARVLGLQGIEVVRERVERAAGHLHFEDYDAVTARAMTGMKQTIGWCAPYLHEGGVLFAFHGPKFQASLKEASEEMHRCRVSLEKCIAYNLPARNLRRHLLVLRKTGSGGPCPAEPKGTGDRCLDRRKGSAGDFR